MPAAHPRTPHQWGRGCPARALARCIRCGHCVAVCPKVALTLEHIAPSSLPLIEDAPLSDLQRDMLFKTRRSTRAYKDDPVDRSVLLKRWKRPVTRRRHPTARKWRGCWWKAATDCTTSPRAWRTGCRRSPENTAMWRRLSTPGQDPILRGPFPHPRARRRQDAVERHRLCRRRQLSGTCPAQLRHRDLLERFRHRRRQQRAWTSASPFPKAARSASS